jgi:putative hemolysin
MRSAFAGPPMTYPASYPSSTQQAQPAPGYSTRVATSHADLRAAQALRFEVFNLELDEGLVQSYDTGLDADPYDDICDHLIVEDTTDGSVVGTYRLQTGQRARSALGYYSEREFDFSPFEATRGEILELGRACIHHRHRSFAVLNLLWKGVGTYAREHGARYLIGCSSFTTQDAAVGAAAYQSLLPHLAPHAWQTRPLPAYGCALDRVAATAPRVPRLLSAYLALGAKICGPPALDLDFKTLDFLTWIDIQAPAVVAMQRRGRFVV